MKKILTTIITTLFLLIITPNVNIILNAQSADPTVLTITGTVNHQTHLTLAELQAMPKTTVYAAIICVDFPSTIVEEGNWTGVKLATLLETAGLQSDTVKIVIAASDGYSSDLTVDTAKQVNVILSYEKDGQSLNGLRLVVPNRWGYKWVNQVIKIEAVDYNYLGFWESMGYSDSAIIGQAPRNSVVNPTIPTAPPNTPAPSTTPNPSITPNTTPSQNATTWAQATQQPSQNPIEANITPTEAIYAIAIAIAAAMSVTALIIRKKSKK